MSPGPMQVAGTPSRLEFQAAADVYGCEKCRKFEERGARPTLEDDGDLRGVPASEHELRQVFGAYNGYLTRAEGR